MTHPPGPREGLRLDKIATVLVIVLCIVAIAWIVRDLARGDGPIRVTASSRVPAPPTIPPVRPAPPLPAAPISIDGAVFKGSAQARVVLVAYSDFQCPYCARFAQDTWPAVDRQYVATGKVRMAFRQFPLENIHPFALKAAEAAECAGQQGQFWGLHDLLYQNQKQLGDSDLKRYAQQVGVSLPAFETCLGGQTTSKVRADAATGAALGGTCTPAFFVGIVQPDGRVRVVERIVGARPFDAFKTSLDRVLGMTALAMK